jgi:TolB-like protein/Tfp pilus assembly protein PilF
VQFLFDNHTLDIQRRELLRGGEPVAVQPQVFDLLVQLVQNRERVVSKDDLITLVWGGRIVSDSTFTSRINSARTAIGDNGRDQKLIRTVPRKGVRFVGVVNERANGIQQAGPQPAEIHERPHAAALPSPDRPAIAVLAFDNMSDDPEQEYFSDGISEDIITALSKQRWFLVISRNSSFTYKGRSVHIKQLADELGVRYVVEGSVRKSGGRVRVTAQLNDVTTGSHLWAERYDRDLADVFAVQDEITRAVVAAIEPQIYVAENFRSRRKPPNSLDAWDLVMRALSHFWRVTRPDHMIARALLEKAIEIDPNYGQALAVLATIQMAGAHMGWADMATTAPIAERAALAAIMADSEDPWAHNALGSVYISTGRLEDSLAQFELALQLNPNFTLAQGYYGLALTHCGRWREALDITQRALRLSPRDPFAAIYYAVASYAQYASSNYHEAIALSREAIRLRGDFAAAYRVLTVAASMTGQIDVATSALQELRRVQPNISLAWVASQLVWQTDADRDHYLEGFRRAGLD